jgi:hypothetical protein
MLQSLDVCINWPFKAALKEKYTQWMAAGEHEFMPMGKKSSDQMLSSFVSGLEKHGHAFRPL